MVSETPYLKGITENRFESSCNKIQNDDQSSISITNIMEKDFVNSMEKETQAVKVAVHVRPLIASEKIQECKECITIKAGEPQIQMGNVGFTFDHVYGSNATPSSRIFEECVAPLVDGMFQGYNATVLAYGQTGSGKTFTMGTSYTVGDNPDGIIPKAMDLIFKRVENSAEQVEYQVRVSFIEILNEEVYDLLDANSPTSSRADLNNGFCTKPAIHQKPMLQIREATNGEITLSGVTDCEVSSLHEMATLLELGSLSRATASTNMNLQSSRSHAILTITLRQQRKFDNFHNDYLCAKLHLVDLAGSERVKRTGADGVRFKEGVHINKGLLSLGNVISALGDEKKRKEGGHVPYRDSKLTRLLQDSLGGNSRTIMIACISPADSNAEETLNTLKYANRARNIQNKPVVNRDPMAAEMQRMREQLELLQAELLCNNARNGCLEDTNSLKQKIAWLERSNAELHQELQRAHDGLRFCAQRVLDAMTERDDLRHKLELLRNGKSLDEVDTVDGYQTSYSDDSLELLQPYTNKFQDLESSFYQEKTTSGANYPSLAQPFSNISIACNGNYLDLHKVHNGDSGERIYTTLEDDEAAAKELEHTRLQVSMDTELNELNEKLKQKEAEMKIIFTSDNIIMKQQFEKKLLELEEEKKTLQEERDKLLVEIKKLSCVPYVQNKKIQDAYSDKLNDLECQLSELKEKQDKETQVLKQKFRGDDAAKHLHEEILRMKSQKVQLQQKIKQEADQFRCWKASREKELLQLRKEGRKNEYEMLKLQALNQRQKMVLQRKTEEAAMASRRLKELLEARKSCTKEIAHAGSNITSGSVKRAHANHKALLQAIDQELELAVHIREVRRNYENQVKLRDSLAIEHEKLIGMENAQDMLETMRDSLDFGSFTSCPDARQARAELLKNILDSSSHTLVAMASQLSEAEERERVFTGRSRWEQLRTMADAKSLLHYVFNLAIDARCQLWNKTTENKELKENIEKLTNVLKQSEAYRIEAYRQLTGQAITNAQVSLESDISRNSPHIQGPEYGFKKVMNRGSKKKCHSKLGKLVRWRRSHERWSLQFKGRWQKPWTLSESIRQGDVLPTRASSSRVTSLKLVR